jgi:hypothetical protein
MPKATSLRPVQGQHIGTTSFFRNRSFTRCLLELIGHTQRADHDLRILFHSCSLGAEPYSFVMEAKLAGLLAQFRSVTIDATDVEPRFVEIAKAGIYDGAVMDSVPHEARAFFEPSSAGGTVQIVPALARWVNFLAPSSFVDFVPSRPYDVVLAMNSLAYVSPSEQLVAIQRMGSYAHHLLCITAFSPDIIKQAVDEAGFVPVPLHWRSIYYGWENRLRWKPAKRGSQRHSWVLPVIPLYVKDRRYKVCSIFQRAVGVAGA